MSTFPVWPVHVGLGPKYRAALETVEQLRAEVDRLRAQNVELQNRLARHHLESPQTRTDSQ
jgi:FtsZ-binding cell division protein ZapB